MNETLFGGYRQKNIKSKPLTLTLFRRLEISDKQVKLAVSGIRETRPASHREALQLELKHEGVLQELGFTLSCGPHVMLRLRSCGVSPATWRNAAIGGKCLPGLAAF